jgi:4-hydroxy-tetrahydrodipicolinate synthase
VTRFPHLKGLFGLLPTPYRDDLEIHTEDLRRVAHFCCETGQHGIVWPVMVGEFYVLGEQERVRNLDAVLEAVNGRLPVVFGCSGISVPQSVFFARAARDAGADAVIAMAPARSDQAAGIEMFRRIAEVFEGPIIVQNADGYAPLTGEQIAGLIEEIPTIEYIKEERQPGPRHIEEVKRACGERVTTIFGGAAGKVLLHELRRGANGCMPACEWGDVLAKVMELWWAGNEEGARDLHRRLLPLLNLETHPYTRSILKRRGVFTSLVERIPAGKLALDDGDQEEITILAQAVAGDLRGFPLGPA